MKRKKGREEESEDLLGHEPRYSSEGQYTDREEAGDVQQKYVPRHSGKKRKAPKQEADATPPPPPAPQASRAYPGAGVTGLVPGPPHDAGGMEAAPEPVVPGEAQIGPSASPEGTPFEPAQGQIGEGATPGYGYYWVPPGMFPPPYNPQAFGYGGVPPEAGPPPGVGYPYPPPPVGPPFGEPPPFDMPPGPTGYDEELGFRELAQDSESHWRVDFKWVFGLLATAFILGALMLTGFYRVSSQGSSKEILSSLVLDVTKVESVINENYTDLRSKARKKKNAVIVIPDIDMDIEVSGEELLSMDEDELAEQVAGEIAQMVYAQGYNGDLPMKNAQGAGEERAQAVCVTFLSSLNKGNHENLLIMIIITAGISLIFFILFIVFCRGWGKVAGPGILLICAALPGSLFLRLGGAFFWNTSQASLYEGSMYQVLLDIASASALFFDIALGIGALLLLIGAIGGAVSGKQKKRIPPFTTLETQEDFDMGTTPADSQ